MKQERRAGGWIDALATALAHAGVPRADAAPLATDVVAGLQGALVLARALGDDELFTASLHRLGALVTARIAAPAAPHEVP
jgi:TetR/AcrR family transcriptional regulator, lmrAB and yxaGH operons repressor